MFVVHPIFSEHFIVTRIENIKMKVLKKSHDCEILKFVIVKIGHGNSLNHVYTLLELYIRVSSFSETADFNKTRNSNSRNDRLKLGPNTRTVLANIEIKVM